MSDEEYLATKTAEFERAIDAFVFACEKNYSEKSDETEESRGIAEEDDETGTPLAEASSPLMEAVTALLHATDTYRQTLLSSIAFAPSFEVAEDRQAQAKRLTHDINIFSTMLLAHYARRKESPAE